MTIGAFEDIVIFRPTPDIELTNTVSNPFKELNGDLDHLRKDGPLWADEQRLANTVSQVPKIHVVAKGLGQPLPADVVHHPSRRCLSTVFPY